VASILPPFCGSQSAPKRTSEAKRKWDNLLPTPEFELRLIESAKEVDVYPARTSVLFRCNREKQRRFSPLPSANVAP